MVTLVTRRSFAWPKTAIILTNGLGWYIYPCKEKYYKIIYNYIFGPYMASVNGYK